MDGNTEEAPRKWLQSKTQLSDFRAGPGPGMGTLRPQASLETMPPLPGTKPPSPESSFQVHRVPVTVFIELDDFPTVQRTTHFSGDHISKHVSHPHKGRAQKARTRDT